tara:strand:- start:121 stop:1245 length:1125 start_codon:yes stop_codon:yes gene_type:complete
MKTIKILISVPLDKRNFERFDIDIYLNFFDKIEIYHIHEGIDFKKDRIFNNKKIKIFNINNYLQLLGLLLIDKGTIYLDYTLPGLKSYTLKTILYFKKYKKIVFKLGNQPTLKVKKISSKIKIFRILKFIHIKLFEQLEDRLFTKRNIYFCAGKKMYEKYKRKNMINCHSYDLNQKLKFKNHNKKKNYFLYLDQYEHNHPDYKFARYDRVNPIKFYKSLNNFFERLEKKYKKNVIIAAHPKAKKHSYFKNRKVISDKIVELSQNCFSTIAHTTTSISFSIIFNKPIIFIVNNEMLRVDTNKKNKISNIANELKLKVFNIDKNNYINNINDQLKNINEKEYINYYKNYISYKVNNDKRIGEIICGIYSKINLNFN